MLYSSRILCFWPRTVPAGSALPSLQLSLVTADTADIVYFSVAHLAEFRAGSSAAGAALAVYKERSGFVAQKIYRIVDSVDGNVAAPADMPAAVLFFGAHIQKDGTLGCPIAVDFLVNIYRLENIQK